MNGLLVFTVFFPAVAAGVVMLTVPRESVNQAKWLALIATLTSLVGSVILLLAFDRHPGEASAIRSSSSRRPPGSTRAKAGFDVQFHMGVDGLGITMVLLTTFLFVIATLISFGVKLRTKEYFIWILALETGVLGVFTSLDLIMFFLFWEVELLPMYMLISVWGSGRKEYSAMKFLLYTIAGSAFMLVGFLAMGFSAEPVHTFDMVALQQQHDRQRAAAALGDLRVHLHRVRGEAADVPAAHMATRRAHRCADRRLRHPGRRAAEDGRLRHAPHPRHADAGDDEGLRRLARDAGRDQRHLRRDPHDPAERPETPRRLFVRQPYGLRAARHRRARARQPERRRAADVHARHDHGAAVRDGRHHLRPHAHPRHRPAQRPRAHDAARGDDA